MRGVNPEQKRLFVIDGSKALRAAINAIFGNHPVQRRSQPIVDVVLDAVGPATLPTALDMLRPGGRLVNILTVTADGDIEGDRKEAERRGYRKIVTIIDFERAQESMREITNLIDAGLVHVPPIDVPPLEDAAQAHRTIETGHVRGKLVLKVADLDA
jgi:NADPH2:quinone reductase